MLATSGSSRSKSEAEELALSWYLDRLISFVEYDGEEKTAEAIVPAFFAQIPRCWLRTHPAYNFMLPEEMDIEVDEEAVDFALVLRSICSPGLRRPSRDGLLRVNLAHPAMVVGIKGPARWGSSDSPFFKYQSDTKQRDSLPRSMRDLCCAVQSSLHTHSIYWDYLQAPIDDLKTLPYPYQSRPEWLVVFGVVYDAAYIRIVAHIPYFVQNQVLKHLSFIVDSIPFTHGLDGALDRARAALALFSLRKHAFRLSNVDKLRRSEWHHRTILTQILSEEHEYLPYDNVEDPLGSNSYDSDNEDVKDGEVLEDHKIEEDGDESDDIEEDGDESDDDHYEALDMLFEGVYKAEADGGELDEGESEEGESEEGESEEEGSSEDESNEAESNEAESSEAESSEEESDEGESDPNDESKILGWDKPIEYEDKDPLHQDVNKATYQVTMNKDFRKKVKKCQDAYACKAMAEDMVASHEIMLVTAAAIANYGVLMLQLVHCEA
ncbi:hypothetical protein EWM64_g3776 [Hericium alpestre]|uniref:Uncharacterized protein n=1 Tax=Hericium alpestre TaxID=135208 RepID=A0A4Z0A3G5_9AGAM|nr:hypothetical protein EWM64_g3776 [Hericium alpestre]